MLLQDAVQSQASAAPDATAIVAGIRSVTYRQMDDWSTQLAHLLIQNGCRPGDRVGLYVPKSIEAIVAMLGILKAGGVYVPMDSRSPAARLARIVESCTPVCILASRFSPVLKDLSRSSAFEIGFLGPGAHAPAGQVLVWDEVTAAPTDRLPPFVTEEDPAHILFTSGSTGMPKGVIITHRNVLEFLNWANPYFGITPSDRNSCHPPLHFELSTFDIYGTFRAGAALHLVSDQASLLPQTLAEFIRRSQLTQWFSVPSALKFMAQFDCVAPNDFPHLKRLLWCGEALPTPTLRYWMQRLPHVQFTNLYGPTEATIASSYYTVPAVPESDTEPIPIGVACGGEDLQVLTETLEHLPDDEIGDLYIGGVGLSPGYWCDPEKTASVFVTDATGRRLYKTGDLARRAADGRLYLLGRADTQIKSRGYRIELGEIETALLSTTDIAECAVVAIQSESFDGSTICCAFVPREGAEVDPAEVREQISQLLPHYMLPARWMKFDALPLNGNGKIDRPRVRQNFEQKTVAA
jgi:amino acid adenylation domain-containing protein